MNTGRVRIAVLLVLLGLGSGCATQQPGAILSAADLDAMIRVEVRLVEPDESPPLLARNDQP